eukprot:TRINITY_DN5484_c0_g2_i1.p1 TRINITY_DN5484_c0_g2~~TRINITY_DN5484_c0_g2_i1.p1  ORF type:complete len:173 (-),score=26.16 TRINITY_DN5484_c0_g2_i1:22-540(-)
MLRCLPFIVGSVLLICVTAHAQRIINGQPAASGEFPYMAALTLRGSVFCGGTLYASQYVVTAMHCFLNSDGSAVDYNTSGMEVRIGCLDYTRCTSTGGEVRSIAQLIPNPRYNPRTNDNDVMVLQLNAPVALTPVTLISSSTASSECPCNIATAAGYGLTKNGGSTSDRLRF